MSASDPWSQQPDESAAAYEGFGLYRDAPPANRALRQVAATLGKSERLIERWSSRWSWSERCRLFDAHLDREMRRVHQQEVLSFRQRAATQARGAAQVAMLPAATISMRIEQARGAGQDLHTLFAALSLPELVQLAIVAGRGLPALLRAEADALGDGPDRAGDAVVAAEVDQLTRRIQADAGLRSIAAVLVERASCPAGATLGGVYEAPKPRTLSEPCPNPSID
jgi:hypothetical protein